MHFYALIPVVAILVSAAFGAVSVAWDSDRRATAPMCGIFTCTGVWALLDLMTFLETDPASAQFWIQWMHLPALLLGPSTTWLLGQMLPQFGDRLQRLARTGFVIAAVLGVAAALLPGSVLSVVAPNGVVGCRDTASCRFSSCPLEPCCRFSPGTKHRESKCVVNPRRPIPAAHMQ